MTGLKGSRLVIARSQALLVVGSLCAAVSAFLPWATVTSPWTGQPSIISGLQLGGGLLVLVSVVICCVAMVPWRAGLPPRLFLLALVFFADFLVANGMAQVIRPLEDGQLGPPNAGPSTVDLGLYLALVGSVLETLAAVWWLPRPKGQVAMAGRPIVNEGHNS